MIPVQNVYYMLSYAFRTLQEQGYKRLATEEFHNTAELCSAILTKGLERQAKRGIYRDYMEKTEPISALRGKLNISESVKMQTVRKKQMICTVDDFSINTELNQIIKSTMLLLLRSDIDKSRKKAIRSLLTLLSEVDETDLHSVNWNQRYNRCNAEYRMLISVCFLVYKGLLQTQKDGRTKLMDFVDDQRMCRLYEKFILEYYRKEHPELTANASQIVWQLDDGFDAMLPNMQTDIMLSDGDRILIIDAKYYTHITQTQYGISTWHSNNMYQIFTYVKNKESELSGKPHSVSGMLLYAKTDEEKAYPSCTYQMSGNQISVHTLDLNTDFREIKKQLDEIVEEWTAGKYL